MPKVLGKMEQGEIVSDEPIIRWMEFFSGKTQEDFEIMAKQDEYMEEAVNTLFELSADEKKRLEYEAREKAIRDHNWKMYNARQSGLEEGITQGIELAIKIFKAKSSGKTVEDIAEEYSLSVEQVKKIVE